MEIGNIYLKRLYEPRYVAKCHVLVHIYMWVYIYIYIHSLQLIYKSCTYIYIYRKRSVHRYAIEHMHVNICSICYAVKSGYSFIIRLVMLVFIEQLNSIR